MIKFIEQILLWVPELKGKLILATIYKILESIFMGAPYVFIFLCLNDLLAGSLTINKVILYTGGMFFCFAMQALFSYRFNRIIWPAANYTVKELRIMAGEHLRKLSMGYFAKKKYRHSQYHDGGGNGGHSNGDLQCLLRFYYCLYLYSGHAGCFDVHRLAAGTCCRGLLSCRRSIFILGQQGF